MYGNQIHHISGFGFGEPSLHAHIYMAYYDYKKNIYPSAYIIK